MPNDKQILPSVRVRSRSRSVSGGYVPIRVRTRPRFLELAKGDALDAPTRPDKANKGGRPSKLTPETEEAILSEVRKGTPLVHSAEAAGITYETLNRWRNAGIMEAKAGNVAHPLALFCQALRKAEAESVSELVDKIKRDDAWQSAAWLLERRHPGEFGKSDKLTLAGRVDGAHVGVTFTVDAMREDIPDASLIQMLQKLSPALVGGPAPDPLETVIDV